MKITDIEGMMLRLPEVHMIGEGCQQCRGRSHAQLRK